MLVHVTLHPSLRAIRSGERQSPFDLALPAGTTAADLLASLACPRTVVVMMNGRPVSNLATPLVDDDDILLLVPISGG